MSAPVLLYVEDDDSAHYLLQTAVQEAGINLQLHRVSDGSAAIAFLHRANPFAEAPRPDMILLDLNLPGRSGLSVLSEVRSHPALSGIPVVVFTSSSRASDKTDSLSLGAAEYIIKPSTYDGFVNAVLSACSRLPAEK